MPGVEEIVKLKDGRAVALRPIAPEDAPRLIRLHRRLSADTQYLRFFGPKPDLSPEEADYLAGVDFQRRVAVVAVVPEADDDSIVAVGRFDVTDDESAETAIVVRDDYQGQGLGSAVLNRLIAAARTRGLREFSGEVLPENTQMLGLLRRYGLEVGASDAVVNVRATIQDQSVVFSVPD